MSAYFVTAIGTDIGKTYAGGQLLSSWRRAGHGVAAVKPLMSGFAEDNLTASDAGVLLRAMGRSVTGDTVSEICHHRFAAPLAPNVAMRRAGMEQDYNDILAFTRAHLARSKDRLTLVEGAGGVMSPVTDDILHIDFMVDLGLPVILVAAGYLGAVSHTLTAITCLQARKLEIAALIVSQPTASSEDPGHLIAEVARWQDVPAFALHHEAGLETLANALSSREGVRAGQAS